MKKIVVYTLLGLFIFSAVVLYALSEKYIPEQKISDQLKENAILSGYSDEELYDFNGNGVIDDEDIAILGYFEIEQSMAANTLYDANGDGVIDIEDYKIILGITTSPPILEPAETTAPSDGSTTTTEEPVVNTVTIWDYVGSPANGTKIPSTSEIFTTGKYDEEYFFKKYNDIQDSLVSDIPVEYFGENEKVQELVTGSGEALFTIEIFSSFVNHLHIYGKSGNNWIHLYTIDLQRLLYMQDYSFDGCVPVLDYGTGKYRFYTLSNDSLYSIDPTNDQNLTKRITHKKVTSILDNQMMLEFADSPLFTIHGEVNSVRFMLGKKETVINLPKNKSILNIKQVTALEDRLIFSFFDGKHYITEHIASDKPGVYDCNTELERLAQWNIDEMFSKKAIPDRLYIRLYNGKLYHYDVE